MQKSMYRVLWGVAILALVSLSCGLLSDAQQRVDGARRTAESAATLVQEGRNLLETGQAFVTQAQGNEVVQTALALATQQGPSMLATAQAFATQEGPGMIATVQALATQNPWVAETAQAAATAGSTGDGPADVPIVTGTTNNMFATQEFVSYSTSLSILEVKEFYEREMPANGWTRSEVLLDARENVIITYTKLGREATLSLALVPGLQETYVMVVIENP